MKARFLTALQKSKILGDLGRGDRIDDNTFITNNKNVIKDMLPCEFVLMIGSMEAKSLYSAEVAIYSNEEIPDNADPNKFLINKVRLVNTFLSTIWVFKDNSINIETSFLFYGEPDFKRVDSNFIGLQFTSAAGNQRSITINRDELKKIREFFRSRVSLAEYSAEIVTQLTKGATKGAPRISVAFYHAQSARMSNDIAIKVANYCSALEALFATSHAELAHQLSERVAFFLEDDPEKRLTTYRNVKNAYTIRSKIVHGAVIKDSKVEDLVKVSRMTDNLLRECLSKIYGDEKLWSLFSGSNEALDEYMLGKIVGGKP